MCGIVGAVAHQNVSELLLNGLKRLEYRGYDSAGMAVIDPSGELLRRRAVGKIAALEALLGAQPLHGATGIAHTRWATHGAPTVDNAHPHVSRNRVAVVHNGIIENHHSLKTRLQQLGYRFESDTDTEVIAHQIDLYLASGAQLLAAVATAVEQLEGAFAIGVIRPGEPGRLVAARRGSPLVIGLGEGENYIASDIFALLGRTQRFLFLEDGDVAELSPDGVTIVDRHGVEVQRPLFESHAEAEAAEKGPYRHFMLKEIHEQPEAIRRTLQALYGPDGLSGLPEELYTGVRAVQIVACGTSYHAGLVAKYWFESLLGLPTSVEVASEFRYRSQVVPPGCWFVAISQSGETADTLAALLQAKTLGYACTLAICNVPQSAIVRAADHALLTRAGPEVGVASTKAFTTQLLALLVLGHSLGLHRGMDAALRNRIEQGLERLPSQLQQTLALDTSIEAWAEELAGKQHSLYLGRGIHYPIALEGALKLKEISYIHAEAYPAGELKHGPLALIDQDMPVIAVAPNDELLEKLKGNLQEVQARGGRLYVFADLNAEFSPVPNVQILPIGEVDEVVAPIFFTVPLQLLAYHAARIKGTDIDQPRNLAKSVTVE